MQIGGAFELLRPNVKDILYTLEVNTFKDGLLKGNDHAGCGFLLTRMAEGGNIKKGPVGVGVRLQETMRVGPFKVETVAAQVSETGSFGHFVTFRVTCVIVVGLLYTDIYHQLLSICNAVPAPRGLAASSVRWLAGWLGCTHFTCTPPTQPQHDLGCVLLAAWLCRLRSHKMFYKKLNPIKCFTRS